MRANTFIPRIGNLNSLLTQVIRSPFMCIGLVVKSAKSSRKARQGFSLCGCRRRSLPSLLLCNRLAHVARFPVGRPRSYSVYVTNFL